ncbi:ABC transporter substrate-binding protein [Prodigiosinella confusarubida]|uniref:ABC transporter substrate-binding protein n=1 Tax=Serratia sp. (strain ATCC 39006) TaxID=104623 RepID=A0A2I5TFV7_SERS3|nr:MULTISPECIES: ABC transporter substrate-binding protein [Enterobacterales]AUG99139.1 ABC transporter substrate-binding protein [Serratia sp. ATCC 39006]AUH03455.1 ABC transporter substrate-binding protein [Serratia sp. ATCC 39006]
MKKLVLSAVAVSVLFSSVTWAAPSLPADIKAKGELTVAIMPNYPPMEFKNPADNQLTGADYDLGNAIGKKLGIKINWQEIGFEQMINAVATKRIDMIMSGMTDTKKRQDVVSFVDYFTTGPQFYTQASRSDINTALDLCGKKVGSSRRTTFPAEIAAWSKAHCEAAGKPAIVVVGAEGTADARSQLRQHRLDGVVQGSETIPYIMNLEKNTYKPLDKAFSFQYTGIGIDKANTQLVSAVQGALDEMIADGSYLTILKKWGLQDGAVKNATVNQGR